MAVATVTAPEKAKAKTTTRLYVGGLGERVTDEDLRKIFSHLGSIETVDIIRTKGRSFAYINFCPSSDNSLAKLFSMYNGCSWKGGKLKLEKAKEHYIDRLKREWAEDAELVICEGINHIDVDVNMSASMEPKSTLDFEKMQLRMFFPKLRKVKSLPLRGTGKHKYSFQRVEVPPLPVHFCDCPEHCSPTQTLKVTGVHDSNVQSGKINDEEISIMNSVMNRLLNKATSSKSDCIQPQRAQVRDAEIQDGGINDEEINIMDSAMKKLLDKETGKSERQDFRDSIQMNAPTSVLQEDKNKIDEETDDDDIKINTVSAQDFESESWELQTSLINKMARSSVQRNSDETAKNKSVTNRKAKHSNKIRKSAFDESNEDNPSSPIHRKRARLQIPSKESEEHLELKSVTEFKTKKSILSGIWSQKSSWKKLVGDGSSSSFHLSNIAPSGETNNDEQPISTSSKNHVDEHKPSNQISSDNEEIDKASNSVHENLDVQSSQSKDKEGLHAAQSAGPSAGIATRGSSWLQKSSWTKLVGGGSSSSFSISQILPEELLKKQQLKKPSDVSTVNSIYNSGNEPGTNNKAFGGTRGSRFGFGGADKIKDAQVNGGKGNQLGKASDDNDRSDTTIMKKSDIEQKVSNSRAGVGLSETCPFMRSADSLKDWQTAKAALTGANKKRNNNK